MLPAGRRLPLCSSAQVFQDLFIVFDHRAFSLSDSVVERVWGQRCRAIRLANRMGICRSNLLPYPPSSIATGYPYLRKTAGTGADEKLVYSASLPELSICAIFAPNPPY